MSSAIFVKYDGTTLQELKLGTKFILQDDDE